MMRCFFDSRQRAHAPEQEFFNGALHPAAFTTNVTAEGSRYLAPLAGQRALDFLATSPNAEFNADLGNLVGGG